MDDPIVGLLGRNAIWILGRHSAVSMARLPSPQPPLRLPSPRPPAPVSPSPQPLPLPPPVSHLLRDPHNLHPVTL